MNTQHGDPNPYRSDDESVWLDWGRLELNRDIFRFFKHMMAFRKGHPSIGRSGFWRDDVRWYGVTGQPDLSYNSHTLAFFLSGSRLGDDDLYVMINAFWQDLDFIVQEGTATDWLRAIDTARNAPEDISEFGLSEPLSSLNYKVAARSVVVLVRDRMAQLS